ncbi:hypothetical protein WICPIJ_004159 [Wickerhamomyces pijperi]|uniref:Uncharacterized protein n=1 Tax=Wickerhamomyces pijperi TaxID=599730 RepID=A0A9P8TN14_WICPI|nr:hypothetical protein WICPIJ_004159 [Wickerhamomyces pijperi]
MSDAAQGKVPYIRYTRLRQVAQKALSECLKPLTSENIASCYPSLQHTPEGQELLDLIRANVVNGLKVSSELEIDLILKELNVKEKLDVLDELVYEAQKRKQQDQQLPPEQQNQYTPVSDLTKEGLIQSYLIPAKQDFLSGLKEQHEQLRQSNLKLLEELTGLSQEAKTLKTEMDENMDFIHRLTQFENETMINTIDQNIVSLRNELMNMR